MKKIKSILMLLALFLNVMSFDLTKDNIIPYYVDPSFGIQEEFTGH